MTETPDGPGGPDAPGGADSPGLSADTGVFAREFDALGRAVELGTASGRLIAVSFPASPPADAERDHELLDRIAEYLAGAEDDFADVTVALTVPTDQRAVLESVRNVPYGETVDLSRVVKMTANLDHEEEADVETARAALRSNPVPLVVPDHRVSGASGATPSDVAERLREREGVRRR